MAKETGSDQKEERGSGQLMLMPLLISFFFKSHFVHKKYSSFLILRVTLAYGSIGNIKVFSSFLNGLPLLQTFPQKDLLSLPLSESTTLGLENSSPFLIQKVLTVMIDEVTEWGWDSFLYLLCASLDIQDFVNDMLFRLREKNSFLLFPMEQNNSQVSIELYDRALKSMGLNKVPCSNPILIFHSKIQYWTICF